MIWYKNNKLHQINRVYHVCNGGEVEKLRIILESTRNRKIEEKTFDNRQKRYKRVFLTKYDTDLANIMGIS